MKDLQEFINNSKNGLNNNDEKNISDEYDLYEKRQIFLDNVNVKSGNEILWIRDKDTVCVSKDRDNRTYNIKEIENLPQNSKVRGYI